MVLTSKLSQINPAAPSAPTDQIVGVIGGTTDALMSVSNVLDGLGTAQGNIIYRGAVGWNILAPGTNGFLLQTSGPGANPSWVTPPGSSGTIVVGTTTITGGTSGAVVYDNAGIFSEAANFSISSGQPNVPTGSAYLYAGAKIAYGVASVQSWYYGNAGNLSTTGSGNTGIGNQALLSLTSGFNNTAFGVSAGLHLTTGNSNLAVGPNAMQNETTGFDNVAIGQSALISGSGNNSIFAIGDHSCAALTGSQDVVAIGTNTLLAATGGNNNIAIGGAAMSTNVVTGGNNTCIGSGSGTRITSGSTNCLIGINCAVNLTTGDHNTIIGGDSSGFNITTGRANTILGKTNATAGLSNAIILADGDGNVGLDFGFTNAGTWTLATGLKLSYISTQGLLVCDSTGTVTSDSSAAAATVTANFTADHRLQVSIGGVTYYIAMSTTAW